MIWKMPARPCSCGEEWCLLPDFGIAGHLINRVVDVHSILDHCAILKHLDLLCHTGDGKVVTVSVKLNTETKVRIQSVLIKIILLENIFVPLLITVGNKHHNATQFYTPWVLRDHKQVVPGDNTGAVIQVTGIREGGERPHRVVACKLRQTLHKIIQLVQIPAFIWTQ